MTTAITPTGSIEIVDRSSMITKLNECCFGRETAIAHRHAPRPSRHERRDNGCEAR